MGELGARALGEGVVGIWVLYISRMSSRQCILRHYVTELHVLRYYVTELHIMRHYVTEHYVAMSLRHYELKVITSQSTTSLRRYVTTSL